MARRTARRRPRSFSVATIRRAGLHRSSQGSGSVEPNDRGAPEEIACCSVETGFAPLCRNAGGHLRAAGNALEFLAWWKIKRRSDESKRLVKKEKLLGAEDGIFRGFGDAEFH